MVVAVAKDEAFDMPRAMGHGLTDQCRRTLLERGHTSATSVGRVGRSDALETSTGRCQSVRRWG
jgi:hypothetical protein